MGGKGPGGFQGQTGTLDPAARQRVEDSQKSVFNMIAQLRDSIGTEDMGGKGGGGDGGEGRAAFDAAYDSTSHPGYWVNKQNGEVYDTGYNLVGHKDTMFAEPAPVAAAAPAPAAPAPAAAAPPPAAETPKPVEAIGPPIQSGGSITQPTGQNTGEALGGSILNPPAYWVGSGNRGRGTGTGTGSLRTTR